MPEQTNGKWDNSETAMVCLAFVSMAGAAVGYLLQSTEVAIAALGLGGAIAGIASKTKNKKTE